jgi:hypothetical protein
MKIHQLIETTSAHQDRLRWSVLAAALALAGVPATGLTAAEAAAPGTNAPAAQATHGEKPPPLPLHNIEGNGGIFSTLSAYLVNPPRDGEPLGRPSVGFSYISLGYGRDLTAITVTETPWKRLELGFGYDSFQLGDLPTQIALAQGPAINNSVSLYNANARLQLLKENDFDQKWIPALTFGTHYKNNDGIGQINNQLGGALHAIGITDNEGVDFTLYASKLFTFLPRPVLLELGGRATKAAEIGLLGFTDSYSFLFEGNLGIFLTDRLILAGEWRQQPNDYRTIPGLVGSSGTWWTVDLAYVLSKHMTVAAGYGNFGNVLNHQANAGWGLTAKYEF